MNETMSSARSIKKKEDKLRKNKKKKRIIENKDDALNLTFGLYEANSKKESRSDELINEHVCCTFDSIYFDTFCLSNT